MQKVTIKLTRIELETIAHWLTMHVIREQQPKFTTYIFMAYSTALLGGAWAFYNRYTISTTQTKENFKTELMPSQAIALLDCLTDSDTNQNEYQNVVMRKIIAEIQDQLFAKGNFHYPQAERRLLNG